MRGFWLHEVKTTSMPIDYGFSKATVINRQTTSVAIYASKWG